MVDNNAKCVGLLGKIPNSVLTSSSKGKTWLLRGGSNLKGKQTHSCLKEERGLESSRAC